MILNLPMIKTTVRMECHPKTNKQKYHIINHFLEMSQTEMAANS